MQYIEIDKLTPAAYNPRYIDNDKLNKLEQSIKENGFLMPVIVNKSNNVIIAGHQRSKAAKKAGMQKVPCYYVENINIADEIMFNQLHNGSDVDINIYGKYLKADSLGFLSALPQDFEVTGGNTQVIKEICKLILRYGNVFQCICDSDGTVLKGANYVKAARLLNIVVNLTVADIKRSDLLCEKYGEFSYSHLQKNTWVQGLAQMNRVDKISGTRKKANRSMLYEHFVKPYLANNPNKSVLDFGCGKGFYINHLDVQNKVGVEFYNHDGKSIKVNETNKQIDNLIAHLTKNGKFDVSVCDSVLNSVDSKEAEQSVMRTLNALTKINGMLFISGRCYEFERQRYLSKYSSEVSKRYLVLLDEDKISGTYRKGNWYYQKFHSEQDAENLIKAFGFKILKHKHVGSSWQICAKKVKDLSIEEWRAGIEFEFNLPLPNNQSYNRQNDILTALKIL